MTEETENGWIRLCIDAEESKSVRQYPAVFALIRPIAVPDKGLPNKEQLVAPRDRALCTREYRLHSGVTDA